MSEENPTPEVETPAPVVPGSAEYNAQMAAEGQAALGTVPDKFKNEDGSINVENLAKSYMELEKMRAAPAPVAEKAPAAEEAPAAEAEPEAPVEELRVPDAPEEPETPEAPANAKVVTDEEMTQYTSEIMRSGDITSESKAALIERGIPEALITSMVEGQRAKMRDQYQRAGSIVGGEDRLSKIFGWAAKNLDEGQRAAVNAGLASSASEATLRGLASMYESSIGNDSKAAEPREAPRYAANPAGREVVTGFKSKAEYYTAIDEASKDPSLQAALIERASKTDLNTLR
jgi:hypothetical protein